MYKFTFNSMIVERKGQDLISVINVFYETASYMDALNFL